ncbi:hypothetical protein PHG01_00050 [Streptococcus mutans PKUSS-HG01]|nr:hypothetical protein PLG01_00050 [Streptococcus mutans PKUSS-LG01]ESS19527.1 hypothetical protein PHG01_00050 [Streptococcus mutans PKUSS-HG01]
MYKGFSYVIEFSSNRKKAVFAVFSAKQLKLSLHHTFKH